MCLMKVCLSSLLVTEWNLLPKKHTFKEETITYLNTKTTTDRAQQPTSVYLHLRLVFSLGTEKNGIACIKIRGLCCYVVWNDFKILLAIPHFSVCVCECVCMVSLELTI